MGENVGFGHTREFIKKNKSGRSASSDCQGAGSERIDEETPRAAGRRKVIKRTGKMNPGAPTLLKSEIKKMLGGQAIGENSQ